MIIKVSPFIAKLKLLNAAAAEIDDIPGIIFVIISGCFFFNYSQNI